MNAHAMSVTPDAIRQLLDELEANRRSRRTVWATLFNGCASFWKQTEPESVFLTIATLKPKARPSSRDSGARSKAKQRRCALDSSSLPVPRRHFSCRKEGRFWQCSSESVQRAGACGGFGWVIGVICCRLFGRYIFRISIIISKARK
jgi:hypothetical protein